MPTVLIAQQHFDPECVTVFDASTPEKRAKAFTYGIMSNYGQYTQSHRDQFPDTTDITELLSYLDQIVAAGDDAWKLPHPVDHPYTRKFAASSNPVRYSCLAEWLANYMAHQLWIDVRDLPFTEYAWSYNLTELKSPERWTPED